MANIKQFTIQINGVQESINAVESLNTQLNALEARINALASKQVNISAKSSNSTSALNEEEKLVKQIQQTEEKIKATRTESYQQLLAEKDLLKEAVNDQKERAAQERLVAGAYSNTMRGLKEELADIKSVMQTTDLGDEKFKDLVGRASQLTDKLKELEAQYGQFGRNVGNYASAAEGFKGLKITVGDAVMEFDNARQALKALKQEMQTLSTKKDMGIITEEEAERLKSLIPTFKELQSSVQDAGKPMDALMDSMQSLVAITQVGKGFAAFFGLEDTDIEKSIQDLVALQNAMQGLQTLASQMQAGDGIFKWVKMGSKAIDNLTNKIFGLNKATKDVATGQKAQAAATSKVAAASNAATKAEIGQTAASVGLTVGMKVATVAARALGVALKAIGIGILLEGIALAIEGFKALVSWISAESEEEKRANEVREAGNKAYADAKAQIVKYTAKVENFNGTLEQEKKLVEELNKELGDELGTYTSLAEWKDVLKTKGEAYCLSLLKQAEAQAILNQYTENYLKLLAAQKIAQEGGDTWEWLPWNWGGKSAQEKADEKVREIEREGENIKKQYEKKLKEIDALEEEYMIGDFAPRSETGSTHSSSSGGARKTAKDVENDIISQRIKVMREGLVKTIAQYTLERNKRIEEVRKNGIRVGEQEELIEREYQQKVLTARIQYHQKLVQEEQAFINSQMTLQRNNQNRAVSWEKQAYDRRLQIAIDALKKYPEAYGKSLKDFDAYADKMLLEIEEMEWNINKLNRNYLVDVNALLASGFRRMEKTVSSGMDDMYLTIKNSEEKVILFEQSLTERLDVAISQRLEARKKYYEETLRLQRENADKQLEIQEEHLTSSLELDLKAEKERFEKLVGLYNESGHSLANVFRFNEDGTRASVATQNPIQKAFEQFQRDNNNRVYNGMTKQQIGEYLWDVMDEVEEFINELESSFKNGLISFEEYNNTMQSSLLQTFIKSKNDYENYLEQYNQMSRANQNAHIGELNQYHGRYYEAFTEFLDNLLTAQETHDNTMRTIQNENNEAIRQANLVHLQKIQSDNNEYFSNMVTEYDRAYKAVSKTIETYHTQNRISADFGFINLKELNQNLKAASEIIKDRLEDVNDLREELYKKLRLNEITEEDFSNQLDGLNDLSYNLQEQLMEINQKAQESVDNLVNVINNYVQKLGQSIQTVISAFDDYADYQLEKEEEELDKQNDMIQKKLDEQEKIVEEHKNNIESIEDELATARGDRRQQLIDALNAEMAAQRAALAEQKRAEKEKEKLEEQQEELDKKRRKQEYERKLRDILISGALATANGLATSPFVPVGLAMGALAASLTAVQYALAQKQKPYGDGGVIVGRSHAEGGVPVLGGQASVEGGEFITNKVTTAKNVDLLEFINSKRKKVDISDLLDFYNSGRPAKNISSIRTKFADGGVIPSLRSDIELSDRMYQAMEDYANRPTYVQVVDIIDRTERLNEVKVISGLEV